MGCCNDDERPEFLRETERREKALSKAPCFDVSARAAFAVGESGEGGVCVGEIDFDDVFGVDGLLECGNHFGRSDWVTGTVMRVWITCTIGGANGAGNVGGSVLNNLNSGGRILISERQRRGRRRQQQRYLTRQDDHSSSPPLSSFRRCPQNENHQPADLHVSMGSMNQGNKILALG